MKNTLTVEIFRDSDNIENDLSRVYTGVAMVSEFVPQLEIVKDTRRIRLATDTTQALRTESIRWPGLDSDISIVVTERELAADSSSRRRLGFTERWVQRGKSVAIVDSLSLGVEFTTAHEVGHTLGLQTTNQQDPNHCSETTCLMQASQTHATKSERVVKKGLPSILERYGLRPAEYTERDIPIENSVCDTCKTDIARRAFFLIKFLGGDKNIPLSWI